MCPPAIAAGHAFGQLLKPAPEAHTARLQYCITVVHSR